MFRLLVRAYVSEYGANHTDENLMKKCRLGMVIIDGIDS
tara:strand:+ start:34026 stop:34142 length:117 start_codon:yes stop_codon:yes gene_type:complete